MSERKKITQEDVNRGVEVVLAAMDRQFESKGTGALKSRHEIFGTVAEEVNELTLALNADPIEPFHDELVDTAVAALFGVICINADALDW